MGRIGLLDVSKHYSGLDAKSDLLVTVNHTVPCTGFRPQLKAVWRRPPEARKSKAGRKPWDAVVTVKALVLCELYNLSDEFEHQEEDRLSFMRVLGLRLEDPVPDATTVYQHRDQLVQARVVEELFGAFDGYLKDQGWLAMGGQMIDASIVPAPKHPNDRDENAAIKAGETPDGWDDKLAKTRQKDTYVRWTKKQRESHHGYLTRSNNRELYALESQSPS